MRDDRTTHHERAIVGLSIIDPSTIDRIESDLAGYTFADPDCLAIWPALVELRRKAFPVADTRLLSIELLPIGVSVSTIARLATDAGMPGQDQYHLSVLVDRMRLIRLERFQHRLGEVLQTMEIS